MYSAVYRVFLIYPKRRQFMRRLVQIRTLDLLFLRFTTFNALRCRKKHFFTPVSVKPCTDSLKVGEELTGSLPKLTLIKILGKFFNDPAVKLLALENGIDETLCRKGFFSFRRYCLESSTLPPDLHITISDIAVNHGNHLDIFPYFLRHIREVFPHLECLDDLKKIGDIREPSNWYPEARKLQRKFIFHCGPTNSGKTYKAIKNFFSAKSGIYCAPLKLLAVEIFKKGVSEKVPCDLITGEEVIYSQSNGNFSSHMSCTIEMLPVEREFDVAVIDEIQMLRDPQRGWAWTRALLGIKAKEIHICGEEAAVDIVESILCTTNETIKVEKYKRLSKLEIDHPVISFENVVKGDCIVCFNKNDIYSVAHSLEKLGHEVAIIYGSLPPLTKLAQCEKFNDPNHPCKILVSTDAVGMGLNLNIRRIIFYSLIKIRQNEMGETERSLISVSQALQIAGRAGRFSSAFNEGFVTTFRESDLGNLKLLLSQEPEPIVQAGLIPTVDLIELFSYYLPKTKLDELIDIFYNLCTVDDSLYFMCDLKEIKYLAQIIDHISLPVLTKFILCCSPVNKKQPFVCVMFVRFVKMYSRNQVITADWLCKKLEYSDKEPENLRDMNRLESYHEVMELYLWLSYRFEEYFPDANVIRKCQTEIDRLIQKGVKKLTKFSTAEEGIDTEELHQEPSEKRPTFKE